MRDIILFGMQGSGKGTQGKILAEAQGYQIFETGGELRRLTADTSSELGQRVKAIMDAGNLVSTDVIMDIVKNFLAGLPEGTAVLFDGIPRSQEQYDQLSAVLAEAGRNPLAVYIHLTEEEAMHRLTGRVTCGNCGAILNIKDGVDPAGPCPVCGATALKVRSDDTEEAIRKRLDVFTEETAPIIEHYRTAEKLVEVDGTKSRDEVTAAITEEIK